MQSEYVSRSPKTKIPTFPFLVILLEKIFRQKLLAFQLIISKQDLLVLPLFWHCYFGVTLLASLFDTAILVLDVVPIVLVLYLKKKILFFLKKLNYAASHFLIHAVVNIHSLTCSCKHRVVSFGCKHKL